MLELEVVRSMPHNGHYEYRNRGQDHERITAKEAAMKAAQYYIDVTSEAPESANIVDSISSEVLSMKVKKL